MNNATESIESLSARRAWIEIITLEKSSSRFLVALRKESVDRNPTSDKVPPDNAGRSPQGERG